MAKKKNINDMTIDELKELFDIAFFCYQIGSK